MKSRIQWLNLRDRNIKFLQTTTLDNRRKNKIHHLQKQDNSWITNQIEIEYEMRNYLINTYSEENNRSAYYLSSHHFNKITNINSANQVPSTTPSKLEIKTSLESLAALKAPGEDGFHAVFYQKN